MRAARWMLSVMFLCVASAAAAQPKGDPPADGEAAPAEVETATEAAPEAPAAEAPDLSELRARYRALRDRLFQSRARAAAVGSALYSTRLQVNLHFASGRSHTVSRAIIRLDGASVFDNLEGVIAQDEATRFSGYVAPGRHVITIRVEAASKDDPSFSSAAESSFVVQAPAGKDLVIDAVARDEGDMGYAWGKEGRGSYGLHLDVDVKARAPAEDSGHIRRSSRAGSAQTAVIAAQVSKQLNFETQEVSAAR